MTISEDHTSPNEFAPNSFSRVPAGSVGCRALPQNVCYSVSIATTLNNLEASNLFFAVSNTSRIQVPVPSNVPLGPGASISMLNSTSAIVGVWNYSADHWSHAPSGVLPVNVPVSIVLDTGLDSNATLAGSSFYVEFSSDSGGGVGFPIGWW